MKHLESRISAHHNYLVNNVLTPGFALGHPGKKRDFYFLADVVLPGESTPRISGRLFDAHGDLLLELNWNRIGENPGGCSYRSTPGGFRIRHHRKSPFWKWSLTTSPTAISHASEAESMTRPETSDWSRTATVSVFWEKPY